tara:strand:+ start:338 stop:523 length:186 start_codon:yes stop_codon:yes gene_type:complete
LIKKEITILNEKQYFYLYFYSQGSMNKLLKKLTKIKKKKIEKIKGILRFCIKTKLINFYFF